MYDFTKYELEDIYAALMNTEIPIFENLPSKVQFMIDNYCEHNEGVFYESDNPKQHCLRCKREI